MEELLKIIKQQSNEIALLREQVVYLTQKFMANHLRKRFKLMGNSVF